MVVAAGTRPGGGSITVNGKWIASSSPSRIASRSRPGASAARAIAAARPAAERVARYSATA